jgi:hypothetical protein
MVTTRRMAQATELQLVISRFFSATHTHGYMYGQIWSPTITRITRIQRSTLFHSFAAACGAVTPHTCLLSCPSMTACRYNSTEIQTTSE